MANQRYENLLLNRELRFELAETDSGPMVVMVFSAVTTSGEPRKVSLGFDPREFVELAAVIQDFAAKIPTGAPDA